MPLVSKWPATFELNGFLFNLPERTTVLFGCHMFPSLARLAQESLKRDPHAGDLYVFRGRRGGLIKIIWHDGHGACQMRHLSSLRRLRARLFKKPKFSRKIRKSVFPPRSNSAILSWIKADMAGEAKVAFDIFSNLRFRYFF